MVPKDIQAILLQWIYYTPKLVVYQRTLQRGCCLFFFLFTIVNTCSQGTPYKFPLSKELTRLLNSIKVVLEHNKLKVGGKPVVKNSTYKRKENWPNQLIRRHAPETKSDNFPQATKPPYLHPPMLMNQIHLQKELTRTQETETGSVAKRMKRVQILGKNVIINWRVMQELAIRNQNGLWWSGELVQMPTTSQSLCHAILRVVGLPILVFWTAPATVNIRQSNRTGPAISTFVKFVPVRSITADSLCGTSKRSWTYQT